ncbi:hypothetical protein Tco_0045255 [Tanacetum coccineum]
MGTIGRSQVKEADIETWCLSLTLLFSLSVHKEGDSMSRDQACSSLWSRVMKAIHGEDGKIGKTPKVRNNSCWLNIVNEIFVLNLKGIKFFDYMRLKVGNGNNTSFWYDKWIGDSSLQIMFPRIFALENNKQVVVSDKLAAISLVDSLRRAPRGALKLHSFLIFLI